MTDNALIKRLQAEHQEEPVAPRPLFFNLKDTNDQVKLEQLLEQQPNIHIIDTYEQQLQEFFILQNPPLYFDKPKLEQKFAAYRDERYGGGEAYQAGKWVYLSWRQTLLHILDDEQYQVVRTGRNRNLITAEEQQKYYHSTIGIAGLSVGNSIALALVQTGGGKHLKLADPDTIELTNLNRIRGSIAELTEPKVYLTARQIYELDPYAQLDLFTDGLTDDNLESFMSGLDVIVDEIDDLQRKLHLREIARQQRIPVLMATDNGDSGLLDIERYDQEEAPESFHGRLDAATQSQIAAGKLSRPELGRLIGEKIVGLDVTEPRMLESVMAVGKEIPTWPQLGTAAWLNGVAVATAVRYMLTGRELTNNRAIFSMPSLLNPGEQ